MLPRLWAVYFRRACILTIFSPEMAAQLPSPPFCSAADEVWILHLTCWTKLCIGNDPPPPPACRHRERVATLLRCYHAPLSWSLVTEKAVNPSHQWEGAYWLTPRFQGLLETGEGNMGAGHHLKPIQNQMSEKETKKNPQQPECEA